MTATTQLAVDRTSSVFLFPADDSDASQKAFEWLLKSIYRDGDEVHLLHVIPRIKFQASYGVPAVDYVPQVCETRRFQCCNSLSMSCHASKAPEGTRRASGSKRILSIPPAV